ncbi:hypothetical protein GCM10009560_16240 [Nonomuraea longicatena]|uniref:YkgJ family cysteine cluster protein n=1 Tax=Nonomuraea longicatena TaxID=83682 RepID=A0ABN1NXK2_9ACTN
MSRWNELEDARLAALYAQVPDVGCRGLCQESCGPIGMSPREHQRIREAGYRIPTAQRALEQLLEGGYQCPALEDGKCSVYEAPGRPMLCRLWGAVDSPVMLCEHGCRPAEDLLSAEEGHRLLADSLGEIRPERGGGLLRLGFRPQEPS